MLAFVTLCRISLIVVFMLSLIGKVSSYPTFRRSLAGFGLSTTTSGVIAPLVICGESAVVLGLTLGGPLLLPGLALAAALLLAFTVAILHVLRRKVSVACFCFGPAKRPVTAVDLLRDSSLLLLASVGLIELVRLGVRDVGVTIDDFLFAIPTGLVVGLVCSYLGELAQVVTGAGSQ